MLLGIPYSTLKDRLKTNNASKPQLGRHKSIFTEDQEKGIVEHCMYLAKMFYGLTPTDLKKVIFEFAEKNSIPHRFNKTKKMAGKDWFSSFMKRHPEISLRKPEATSLGRITGFNEESVQHFFKNLGNTLAKLQVGPHRIYNVDETGITTVQVPTKVISPKGLKQLGKAVSYERGRNITVVGCVSASGNYIPPMFIYPRARMSEQLQRNGPLGALYAGSQKGWITEDLFVEWLHHFKRHTVCSKDNPVLLVLDNHASHCSLSAYNFCKENGIEMVSFPPHTSHRLQPLDLTIFGPLKRAYSNECSIFMRQHPHKKITPYDVAEIFNLAFVKIASIDKAQKGFQISGIWPYNPNVFGEDDFLPATVSSKNIVTDNLTDSQSSSRDRGCIETPDTSVMTVKASQNIKNLNIINLGASTSKRADDNVQQKQVPFNDMFPLMAHDNKENISTQPQKKRTKLGISKVLTATPEKEYLEQKEIKKQQKIENKKRKNSRGNTVLKQKMPQKPLELKGRNRVKRKIGFKEFSSSDESDEEILCNDDSSDDMEEDFMDDEICIICNEFGKTEMWYQCSVCKKWAHKDCTGHAGSKPYICDFCV